MACLRSGRRVHVGVVVGLGVALMLPDSGTRAVPYGPSRGLPEEPPPVAARGEDPVGGDCGEFDCSGVSLLSHMAITDFPTSGAACTDIWGYVPPSGREYAIVGFDNKTAFVEITSPGSPVVVAEISRLHSSTWSDMAVWQTYCYVVNDGNGAPGVQVIDISGIDDGTVTDLGLSSWTSITNAHNIWVNQDSGYAYVVGANAQGNGGVRIFDLKADPVDAPFVGSWDITYFHDIEVVTYTDGPFAGKEVAFGAGQNVGIVYVLDVTDKRNIQVMSSATYNNPNITHQTSLTADRRYLLLDDEGDELFIPAVTTTTTHVFDVQNLNAMQYVGEFTNGNPSSDHNQFVRGKYTFQANYRSGLRIYDVSGLPDLGTAIEVGFFDTFPGGDAAGHQGAWGVFVDFPSEVVVVSDANTGFFVLDPQVTFEPSYTDITASPLDDAGPAQGSAWGDVDGDGDPDLYVTNRDVANRYYRNDAGGFVDLTIAPLDDARDGRAASWIDHDGDDDLDLFVGNEIDPNRLFRNDGGVFVDVSAGPIVAAGLKTRGVAWADFDLDGDLDAYLASFGSPNQLLRNEGADLFVDVAADVGVDGGGGSSTGVAWADYDLDGDPDVYVGNFGDADALYRNDGSAFVNVGPVAARVGATSTLGVAWRDHDHDGDPDVCVADLGGGITILRNDGDGAFTDVSVEARVSGDGQSTGVGWGDVDLDGLPDILVGEIAGAMRYYRALGSGQYSNRTSTSFDDLEGPWGFSQADMDGDGDLDLFVPEDGTPNRLFDPINPSENHWLRVDVRSPGLNTRAVGARVSVTANGTTQTQWVEAGSGYLSFDEPVLTFGLGTAETVSEIQVRWTNGVVFDSTDVAADQGLTLMEHGTTPIGDPDPELGLAPPSTHRLHANVPNPFNPTTRIHYDVGRTTRVRIIVFDVMGREVRELIDGVHARGRYVARWDGRDDGGSAASSGAYFLRLEADGVVETRRMTLLR